MKKLGSRLTYANVMSSLAVFLVLGGATAFATTQLGKNSVGNKQLKRNAVSTTKIRNNAVTGKKIKKGTITGNDINAGSTSFSQIVARIRGTGTNVFKTGTLYQLSNPTYTQKAGEDNQFVGAINVDFPASCEAPRSAVAYLLIDAANPGTPETSDIAGYAVVSDKGTGAVTRQANFATLAGGAGMAPFAPAANTNHTFSVFLAGSSCKSGSGITASSAGVDVIATK